MSSSKYCFIEIFDKCECWFKDNCSISMNHCFLGYIPAFLMFYIVVYCEYTNPFYVGAHDLFDVRLLDFSCCTKVEAGR